VLLPATGFVQHFTQRQRHGLEIDRQPFEFGGGQGGEQVILQRACRRR